jgi:O-glycosyl hydrolase
MEKAMIPRQWLFSSVTLLVAVILASGCGQRRAAPLIPGAVSTQVDGSQRFQSIDGFGVNINGTYWNDGKLAPALDTLHRDLGATIFRVIIETPYWEATNDDGDPATFNWDAYNAIYAEPQFRSLFAIIRHLQQMPDAQVMLNIMGAMPTWMGDGVIDPGREDEWVEMVTSLLVYARDREGLTIRLLGPLNEIDSGPPEGPRVEPDQYARLMRRLSLRLDQLGLGAVQLVAPDIAYSTNAQKYLGPLFADDVASQKVLAFAAHDYGGAIADIRGLLDASPHPDRKFWMSEFSQWCEQCQKRTQNTETWPYAADTVSFLLRYLAGGASAAMLYDGVDGYYIHHGNFQAWGVLAYNPDTGDFSPRARFGAAAQIFRLVRPGMVRVAASDSSGGLAILAFLNPGSGDLTIVGRNPSANAVSLHVTLTGVGEPSRMTLYQTTATQSMAASRPTQGTDAITAQIAPDSVFALSSLQP